MERYQLYSANIRRNTIYDGAFGYGEFPYNHMVSLAWFAGRFYAVWGANPGTNVEGQPGQINVVSTSEDFINWSQPLDLAGEELSISPVVEPSEVFWQPNLITVEEELWCFWSYGKEFDTAPDKPGWGNPSTGKGLYLSRLGARESRWEHRKVMDLVEVDGIWCAPFVSQNPYRCSDGRILVPLTLIHDGKPADGSVDSGPDALFNVCAWTDDVGETWRVSNPTGRPDNRRAQWEPCYWEQADGRIRSMMRNFDLPPDRNLPPVQRQLTVVSDGDRGDEIRFEAEPEYAYIETGRTRTQVFRSAFGNRWYMLGGDAYTPQGARSQLALYFSRTGENDFVAGPMYSDRHVYSTYSQGIEHDGRLYLAWTTTENGHQQWRIESAVVDPAPDPRTAYVFPREKHLEREASVYSKPPLQKTYDGRRALHFHMRGSAGIEHDTVDFDATREFYLTMAVRITSVQEVGQLVLCSVGDRIPIRLGMPSNRVGTLYTYGRRDWQPVGLFTLDQWHTLELRVGAHEFGVRIDGSDERVYMNPVPHPNLRVYLGDGYEVDRVPTNDGSEFFVDLDSLRTDVR
jgi:hypothetical protein